jgi:modulator of FtsH protease
VNAYDIAAWTDFANTVAGGAAALAGLLFVGLSLNLSEVLEYHGVPARAAATLAVTVAILLTAIFLATPGQHPRALTVEIAVVGIATAALVFAGMRRQRGGQQPSRALTSMVLLLIPALLLMVAAISLWFTCGGGLYWITAAVATGFASATANAWVLLVEIKR